MPQIAQIAQIFTDFIHRLKKFNTSYPNKTTAIVLPSLRMVTRRVIICENLCSECSGWQNNNNIFVNLFKIGIVRILLILLLCSFFYVASAVEKMQISNSIKWSNPIKISFPNTPKKYSLFFENASFDIEKKLPVYQQSIKSVLKGHLSAKFVKTSFEIVSSQEKEILIGNSEALSDEITIDASIGFDQKEPFVQVSFIPIRKNPLSGEIEKLTSFEIEITATDLTAKSGKSSRSYAENSILISETWFKIGVTQSGIYKLSYDFLSTLGMNISNLDPRNLRIYGNGGGMLPQSNSKYRIDDLKENPIFVYGESDGNFSTSDYVLFYGDGPHQWQFDTASQRFKHTQNIYSDTAFYFINSDLGTGKRIQQMPEITGNADYTTTAFTDYQFHEKELRNLIKSGREWYGEEFDLTTSYEIIFSFPNIITSEVLFIDFSAAARSTSSSSFTVSANGSSLFSASANAIGTEYYLPYATSSSSITTFNTSSSTVTILVNYNKSTSSSIGWLNYIELNARRDLKMYGGQMAFRDEQNTGVGKIAEFKISNSSGNEIVWNVTEVTKPMEVKSSYSGGITSFKASVDSINEFVVFNGSAFFSPLSIGKIEKQNLHGTTYFPDIIIITPYFLMEQASELEEHHKVNDGLNVLIATPQQIYNEFSGGRQDITAIKDFIKMFYDKAGSTKDNLPQYVLFFGDASYDYKNRISDNTNYIPSFQSTNSFSPTSSYVSDDYFGFLDDTEGEWASADKLDVAIGRIPVKTTSEAQDVVDKIKQYTSTSTFGDWRNVVTFLADDEDGNTHINQADDLAALVDTTYDQYNIDKIYLDAYTQITTSGGERYPDANTALNNRIASGTFILNYTGHGGEVGLTHERVIGVDDINNWENFDKLMLFVTATCEFSRFDDPERTSAGELSILNSKGGSIGLLSTTRLVYSSPNYELNKLFYLNVFEKNADGSRPRLGDVFRTTKNDKGTDLNTRNFTLLGDPAITLAYPKYNVITTQIDTNPVLIIPDTLKALSSVTIHGEVRDENDILLSSFNGVVYPTIYDKPTTFQTLKNDGGSGYKNFILQMSKIYKGKASVKNGIFQYTFIVPKDISYGTDFGKLSYYADNGSVDANGVFENVIIGGTAENYPEDNTGPVIELFFNDENFVYGGLVNEEPVLIAKVEDFSGINMVGNGIGHDVTAMLDNDVNNKIVLNDFYESELDNYQKGEVRYKLSELAEGKHDLKFKVWDVYNNSSEEYTEFIVASSAELALEHVLNYPNPFTTKTSFFFEHNKPGHDLNVQINIFTISGKLVKSLITDIITDGNRITSIDWNGEDEYGDRIGKGVYIYQLKVKSQTDNTFADKFEKLVILN